MTIEDVIALSQRRRRIVLSDDSDFQDRIRRGAEFLRKVLASGEDIYGVTTGFGDSVGVTVPDTQFDELSTHLARFHGCGLGDILDAESARAVLVVRATSLAQGFSGIRLELLERLIWLIQEDILPLIPEEGSVGASGDLTPLSYVAALLMGERDALHNEQTMPATRLYAEHGIDPLTLGPKEGLAIMNGTSMMTALACLAYGRAEYLAQLACRLTALAVLGKKGNPGHYAKRLFEAKPHPGQAQAAAQIRADLAAAQDLKYVRLQDQYSLRCAPHVIGVMVDAMPQMRRMIETEINSANDNPIIDPDEEQIYHGGHFYGGHIAYAMDSLKTCVANLADLMDRQMALLVDPKFNNGLPRGLSGAPEALKAVSHGFKAVQIGTSAWAAEALKATMPASAFSRSTESHNQDKVSMGTIAARDCLRVLTLTEQVAAAMILATRQAVRLRLEAGELDEQQLADPIQQWLDAIDEDFPMVREDRGLEPELRQCMANLQARKWELYE